MRVCFSYGLFAVAFAVAAQPAHAQSPLPVIVPAATSQSAPIPQTAGDPTSSDNATIQALEQIKAANEEMLRQQEAVLATLDELQKAADQIRILSKRG